MSIAHQPQYGDNVSHSRNPHVSQVLLVKVQEHVALDAVLRERERVCRRHVGRNTSRRKEVHPHTCSNMQ